MLPTRRAYPGGNSHRGWMCTRRDLAPGMVTVPLVTVPLVPVPLVAGLGVAGAVALSPAPAPAPAVAGVLAGMPRAPWPRDRGWWDSITRVRPLAADHAAHTYLAVGWEGSVGREAASDDGRWGRPTYNQWTRVWWMGKKSPRRRG